MLSYLGGGFAVSGPQETAVASMSRRMVELDRAQALALLASVTYGRVVFTHNALPAIRPVNHLVDFDEIIIRTRMVSTFAGVLRPSNHPVVAYEADSLDTTLRLGWSVVATGVAVPVTERSRIERYERVLQPWVDRTMDTLIAIRPQIITGFRLVEAG